jgi:hypothetical protein
MILLYYIFGVQICALSHFLNRNSLEFVTKNNLEWGYHICFFRFLPGGITPPHGAILPDQTVFKTRTVELLSTGACVTYDVA